MNHPFNSLTFVANKKVEERLPKLRRKIAYLQMQEPRLEREKLSSPSDKALLKEWDLQTSRKELNFMMKYVLLEDSIHDEMHVKRNALHKKDVAVMLLSGDKSFRKDYIQRDRLLRAAKASKGIKATRVALIRAETLNEEDIEEEETLALLDKNL